MLSNRLEEHLDIHFKMDPWSILEYLVAYHPGSAFCLRGSQSFSKEQIRNKFQSNKLFLFVVYLTSL